MLQFSMDKQHMSLEVSFAFRFHGAEWTLQISFSATFFPLVWWKIFLHTVRSSTCFTLERFDSLRMLENLLHQPITTYCCWHNHISISIRHANRASCIKFWRPVGNHPKLIRSCNKTVRAYHINHMEKINKESKNRCSDCHTQTGSIHISCSWDSRFKSWLSWHFFPLRFQSSRMWCCVAGWQVPTFHMTALEEEPTMDSQNTRR